MQRTLAVALFPLAAALSACQQHTPPQPQPAAKSNADSGKTTKLPVAVKAFEGFCYRTNGEMSRVVALAELNKFPPVPEKMMSVLGPTVGKGNGFVAINNRKKGRLLLIGTSDNNTCAVFAMGYDDAAIKEAVVANYHLKLVNRDDTGLQINELYTPNGVKGTVNEGSEEGVIGITTAKEGSGISISFIPPATAKKVFNNGS